MPVSGIGALIAVTQEKTDNANNNAMDGATKQKKLVRGEEILHAQQSKFDEMVTDKNLTADEYWQIQGFLKDQGVGDAGFDGSWDGCLGVYDGNGQWNGKIDDAGADYEKKNAKLVDAAKNRLGDKDKDLQNQDKLGNFEIQGLMSEFNESQTLASSVLKKKDDAGNAVLQKI